MSTPTTELGLQRAVDADDTADYLVTNLANSLTTVDSLFNNVSGHTHSGAHQGGPIATLGPGSVTNANLGPDVARANLLTNGGFEIWQRGNGPFTASGAYGADRWAQTITGGDTLSVSRDTTHADVAVSTICAAVTFTYSAGGGVSGVYQPIKQADGAQLGGRTVTFSARVWANIANAVRLDASSDGTGGGSTYSAYHSGGSTYQTLSVTKAIPADATYFYPVFRFGASCTAYLDNANLVVGSQPADYVPLHPADDLARCLRYYEKLGGQATALWFGCYQAAAGAGGQTAFFAVKKAVTPTLTRAGTTWSVSNCGQPNADAADLNGFRLYALATAAGAMSFSSTDATTYITAESNP
jgi:hypothetical protein